MAQREEEWRSKEAEKGGEIRGLERQLEEVERDRDDARDRLQEARWSIFKLTHAVCRINACYKTAFVPQR